MKAAADKIAAKKAAAEKKISDRKKSGQTLTVSDTVQVTSVRVTGGQTVGEQGLIDAMAMLPAITEENSNKVNTEDFTVKNPVNLSVWCREDGAKGSS